jgi:hypothetical protein
MRKMSHTPFAGKKVRESRTPKTNPRMILMSRTDGRIFVLTISAVVFSFPGHLKDEHEDSNGIAE